jgi:anaerobic selenocysteine-containing dehydrogenase
MPAKTTFSSCYMCSDNCPITVVSNGDQILSIDHPKCVRSEGMLEQRESPNRLISALIRGKHTDEWNTVPLADALDSSAQHLLDIRERHGPEAVAFAIGFSKEVRPYLSRLARLFGTPHYITESSCCFAAGFVAATITLGKEYEYFLGPSRRRCPESRCRLVWSTNPAESMLPYDDHHLYEDVAVVPTIVVDPRRTRLAELATIHLQTRPGTDGALALGIANVIIEHGLHDEAFLQKHAHGFDEYREYVSRFTPDVTSEITGVPVDTLIGAARLYSNSRPAQLTISPSSTTHHSNGMQAHRAILLLPALCGNLDVEGGNRPWRKRLQQKSVNLADEISLPHLKPMGADEHPLFVKYFGEAQGMRLADSIEAGKVKAVFSIGLNVMMWPNSKRLARALRSLEFFSISDFFPSPAVDAATVFFPAATHLERQSLVVNPNGRIQYRPVAVPPRGEAIGDTELVFEIAKRIGLGEQFWNGDIHASFDERLDGTGLHFADLRADATPIIEDPDFGEERSYESLGFGTPTGKVEFFSTELESVGLNGLPEYVEPFWSPVSTPEIACDYPLVLTTGGRSRNFMHSQGRALKTLLEREPFPRIQIHPDDAGVRAISDADWVEISSPLGTVTMKAWVTDMLMPGVVHAVHSRVGHDINELIPDEGLDPISGFPPLKSSLCQVQRLRGS